MALNVEIKTWLWMPNCEENMRGNMPQCGVSPQLSIHKSWSLKKYHNNLDVSSSRYSTGETHRRLKGMIDWGVLRKIVHWGNCHHLNITIYWRVIGNEIVKTQRLGSFEGSSRYKSLILWPIMQISITQLNKDNGNSSMRRRSSP